MNRYCKYGTFILIIFVSLLSLIIIASPVSATSATAPPNSISVPQGGVFLLRGTITFDNPAEGDFMWGPVYWYHYGNADENFYLENTPSVYWEDCTPVENLLWDDWPITNGWHFDITTDGENLIEKNGTFYVDIWLRAASPDGTLHRPGNHMIYFANNQITLWEPSIITVSAPPITVRVLGRGVDVSISPDYQSGVPCTTLNYTVTVRNTGNMGADNYNLAVSDNAGWGDNVTLDNYLLVIPENDSRTTILHVHIPENVIGCTSDNITVTATSRADNKVKGSGACIAHVPVSTATATPPEDYVEVQQGGVFLLRGTITFNNPAEPGDFMWGPVYWYHYDDPTENFTLENTPSVYWEDGTPVENVAIDNYSITNGWKVEISTDGVNLIERDGTFYIDMWLQAANGDGTPHRTGDQKIYFANNRISLWEPDLVTVSAPPITVRVLGRGVDVSISPDYQSGVPCTTLNYTVTVKNTGNMGTDNYDLTVSDTKNWGPTLDNSLLTIPENDSRTTILHVHIPENAIGWSDNITVTATSRADNKVKGSGACIAHVPAPPATATPPENYVEVQQGGVFLLRGTITFNNPAEPGDFMWGPVYWYHNGDPTENFCLENTPSVYWEDGTPVENVIINDYRIPNGLQVEITTDGVNLIGRDGTFYIDIWLRAASGDGTPHRMGDQKIYFAMDQITLWEPNQVTVPAGPITVQVVNIVKLENLYKVSLEKDLKLYTGSKLVVKFYDYDNTLQAENIIDNVTPPYPYFIKEYENVPHPLGVPVEKVLLVLTTDNTEEVISTIASLTVNHGQFRDRYKTILRAWGGRPELHDAFRAEIKDILRQWGGAPS